jgi:aryl-alcohol dehydrogenase-like predicted oxidoreductase
MDLSRREFLRRSAAAAGTVSLPSLIAGFLGQRKMPTRPFGKTGFNASIYTVGTAEVPSTAEAVEAIRLLFKGGVNMVDTAPSYMGTQSESTVGRAIEGRREGLWISTKTLERTADGAYREVKESLGRLKCGHIDLLQVHAVNDQGTLDSVLRKGGAVEGLERAKKEGLVRHIGITGHTRPEVVLNAMKAYPFASVLVPVSALDRHINDFASEVVPYANEHGVAVVGMKALKGIERATPGRFKAEEFLRYSLSRPVSTLNIGLRRPEEAAANLAKVIAFKPMTETESKELEARSREHANVETLWWKRT